MLKTLATVLSSALVSQVKTAYWINYLQFYMRVLFLNNSVWCFISIKKSRVIALRNQVFVSFCFCRCCFLFFYFIFWFSNSKCIFSFFDYELVTQKRKNKILTIEVVTRSETLYFSTLTWYLESGKINIWPLS